MTHTIAQSIVVKIVSENMLKHAPRDTFKALTDKQRGAVVTDWLITGARLNAEEMEALGNYLCNQAWMMNRDKDS